MLLFGCGIHASAQALQSGYFMEGYTYRHLMNPAFEAERNYVSIPALGNVYAGTKGNVALGNFIYKYNGDQLTTFMSNTVSAEEFLGDLRDNNRINANVNLTLLSVGFKKWGGFNTIGLSVRSNTSASLPYDLLKFMKVGMQREREVYDMGNLGVNSQNYVELALGHSRAINEHLRVGGKLKFLIGAAYASLKMNDMRVEMSGDKWMVHADGEMNASVKGLIMPTKAEMGRKLTDPSQGTLLDWENADFNSDDIGPSGFGMAVDLGAVYKLNDTWTFSASLLDFGFMSWSHTIKAKTLNKPWEFDGFHELAVDSELGDDDPMSLKSQADDLGKDLENFASFHREENDGSALNMLGATLILGAEYTLPAYNKFKVGLLSTSRLQGRYSWWEARLSANVSPVKWFDAGVNGSVSTIGSSFGWIVNFHPKGFNLFVGMDQIIGEVNPQCIPVDNMNMSVSVGMNVTF